jgi:hypothetical protein
MLCLGAALLTCLACVFEPAPAAQPPNTQAAVNNESLEYKLAVIDSGGYVARDDLAVARFRSLLGQLDTKYVESPEEIANMSVKAQQVLRDKGISEPIRELMEGLNSVLDGPVGNQKYSEYAALYIQLRDSGRNHLQAVNVLRGSLRELGVQ